MRVHQLLGLRPGTKVQSTIGTVATVLAGALPSRIHGWRVQIGTGSGTTPSYITPANCKYWQIDAGATRQKQP